MELKESENRRMSEEVSELRAAMAVSWIQESEVWTLVTRSVLSSGRGSVVLLECTKEFSEALEDVAGGSEAERLYAALERLRSWLKDETWNKGGCVLLRRVPLHGSAGWCKLMASALFDVGEVVNAGECSATTETTEPGGPPDGVALFCAVPANRKTKARLLRADDVIKQLDADTKAALQRNAPAETRDGRAVGKAAPVLSRDRDFKWQLSFSTELKENIEYATNVSAELVDALAALDTAANHPSVGFDVALRPDDVLVFDAKRWLYALTAHHDDAVPCRWIDGIWTPSLATAAAPPDAAPRAPIIAKAFLARPPTSSSSSS